MTKFEVTAAQRRQLNIRIQDLTAQFDSYTEDAYYHQLGKLTNMLMGVEKFDGIHFQTTEVSESAKPKDLVTVFFFTHVDNARAMKIALQRSLHLIHMPHAMRADASQPDVRRLRIDDVTREFANAFVQANSAVSHYQVKATKPSTGKGRGRPLGSKNKPKTPKVIVNAVEITAEMTEASKISPDDLAAIQNVSLNKKDVLHCGKTEEEVIAEYPQADHSATLDQLLSQMDNKATKHKKVTKHVVIEETSPDVFTDDEIADMLGGKSAPDHNVSMMPESCIIEDNDMEDWENDLLSE